MTNIIQINFHNQNLQTFKHKGEPYVGMKSIVEGMGLDWASQYKKLITPEYERKFNCCVITMVAKDGKNRDVLAIPLKKLNGWLFSINPNKVRTDLKEVIELYQEESFEALYNYWHKGFAVRDYAKSKQKRFTQYENPKAPLLQQRVLSSLNESDISTINELEREANISRESTRQLLIGKIKNPRIDTLKNMAKRLDVSVAYLIGETDLKKREDISKVRENLIESLNYEKLLIKLLSHVTADDWSEHKEAIIQTLEQSVCSKQNLMGEK